MAFEIITRAQAAAQGLKRYFTGVPCARGHVVERSVSNLTCLQCAADARRQKYDPDKNRANGRRWREANREKVAANKRVYAGTPQRKAYAAEWYAANRDRIAEKRRAEAGKYREQNIASAKAWAKANPDKAREYSRMNRRNRRARAKDAGGTHTSADLASILHAQGNRCAYCRCALSKVEKHVDHIVPLARGGSNGRENLQYLCRPCNQSKSARDPIEYAQSIGLLL
jgi:5-methylcytosine-specific restriction endonuclease McrA